MPKRILQGTVESAKNDKTISVRVERRFIHPLYKKTVKKSTKYAAHDPDRRCNVGDHQFIFFACRASLKDGILERGIFVQLSKQLGVTHETVSRQWAGKLFKAAALLDNHHIKEHNNILAS